MTILHLWTHFSWRIIWKLHVKNNENFQEKICAKHISYIYKKFCLVWYNLKHSDMQSGASQSGNHHTVSFLSLFPVELLEFSEQILHPLVGRAFLPVGGILSAKCLPKSLLLDVACETSFWASVAPFSTNPSPTFCRKEAKLQFCFWFSFLVSRYMNRNLTQTDYTPFLIHLLLN